MNDLVSVIVPVYNAASYLKRCVDSLLAQTYQNYEIILVDDGSCDNSFEICKNYSVEHNNIVAVHKENGGISDARNFGLEHASGELIMFVDSDDCVDCKMIEVCTDNIDKYSADIVGFNWQVFSDKLPVATLKNKIKVVEGRKILPFFLVRNRLYCSVRYIYKKSILTDNNLSFDKNIRSGGEDQLFIYNYIIHCNKAVEIDYNGYFYYENVNSVSSGIVKPNHFNDISVRKHIYSDCPKKAKRRAKAHLLKGYIAFCLKAIKYGTTCEEDIVKKYRKIIKRNLAFIMFSRHFDLKRKAAALSVAVSVKLSKKLVNKISI